MRKRERQSHTLGKNLQKMYKPQWRYLSHRNTAQMNDFADELMWVREIVFMNSFNWLQSMYMNKIQYRVLHINERIFCKRLPLFCFGKDETNTCCPSRSFKISFNIAPSVPRFWSLAHNIVVWRHSVRVFCVCGLESANMVVGHSRSFSYMVCLCVHCISIVKQSRTAGKQISVPQAGFLRSFLFS
jgi:hypothetical protein